MKRSCLKHGYVFQSVRCPSFHMQPLARLNGHSYNGAVGPVSGGACAETGGSFRIGGPMWTDPIHDQAAVAEMLQRVEAYRARVPAKAKGSKAAAAELLPFPPTATHERVHGILTAVRQTPIATTMPLPGAPAAQLHRERLPETTPEAFLPTDAIHVPSAASG